MAATTTDRSTKWSYIERILPPIPLTAATKIPAGVMVGVVSGTGTAVNAADNIANLVIVGVSTQTVDTVLGHTKCPVQRGAAWFANDGNITAANIGQQATVLDNQTVSVAGTTTTDTVAGSIEAVDAVDGVLIAFLGSKIGAV